jgi:signal transduction histidine kinase
MKSSARILFVGEDPADAALIEMVLRREHPSCEVVHVGDPVAFGREVERAEFDLAIADDTLSWIESVRVLIELRTRRSVSPVVVLTASGSENPVDLGASELVVAKNSAGFLRLAEILTAALERASSDQSVARLEPRIKGLLQRSRVGVFRCTLAGRLLDADETFLDILGVESMDIARDLDLSHLTPRLPRGFTETGKIYKREQQLDRDGEPVWVALTEVVSLDEEGGPVLDGLLEDISARKGLESELSGEASKLARSNEDLSMFASMAAHELKEPLRTIEQSTRILLEDGADQLGSEASESAGLVIDGVRRLQSMIEGLLTLARFGGGEEWVEECDCNVVVQEALDSLGARIEESDAQVKVKPLPTVRADPMQLRLLFRNLVSNALKFHGERPPEIEVAARQDDENWVFSVEDRGPGIEADLTEKVFDRFSRTSESSGAGLGLAICRQVVERHGGRIWVESELGHGATFYFTLPLSARAGRRTEPEAGQEGDKMRPQGSVGRETG